MKYFLQACKKYFLEGKVRPAETENVLKTNQEVIQLVSSFKHNKFQNKLYVFGCGQVSNNTNISKLLKTIQILRSIETNHSMRWAFPKKWSISLSDQDKFKCYASQRAVNLTYNYANLTKELDINETVTEQVSNPHVRKRV